MKNHLFLPVLYRSSNFVFTSIRARRFFPGSFKTSLLTKFLSNNTSTEYLKVMYNRSCVWMPLQRLVTISVQNEFYLNFLRYITQKIDQREHSCCTPSVNWFKKSSSQIRDSRAGKQHQQICVRVKKLGPHDESMDFFRA